MRLQLPSSPGVHASAPFELALVDVSRSSSLPHQFQTLPALTGEPLQITFAPQEPGSIAGTLSVEGWERPYALRLPVISERSLISATFPLPTEAGPFSVGPIPPGRYSCFIEGQEALVEPLGSLEVRAGVQLDVGSVNLPRPGVALLDARPSVPGADALAVQFRVLLSGTHAAWIGDRPREEPLELPPGNYTPEVQRLDGSFRHFPFAVESGVERWIVVDL